MIFIPNSWEEVLERYKPLPWIDSNAFERMWMDFWYPPRGYLWPFSRIYCNKDIFNDLDWIFVEIINQGIIRSIKTFDGCYNIRPIRGSKSNRWSLHSFGIALDFNASTNILGSYGDMDPVLVSIFKSAGWAWGGDFKRCDPMHFQRAHNC